MVGRWLLCSLLLVRTYAYLPGLPAKHHHRRQSHTRSAPLAVADLSSSAPPEAPKLTPRNADIALAGIGLAGSIALLGGLQDAMGIKLFVPPMMASGIIFFAGPTPPNPKGFLFGTLCSCTLSVALIIFLREYIPPIAADGVSAGVLLVWYKASGAMFPPAAVLAGTLAAAIQNEVQQTNSASISAALQFICFPWLAGHALLYGAAKAMAPVRSAALVSLSKDEFAEALRENEREHLKDCAKSCEKFYCGAAPSKPWQTRSISMGSVPPEDFAQEFAFPLDLIKVTERPIVSPQEAAKAIALAREENVDINEYTSGKYKLGGDWLAKMDTTRAWFNTQLETNIFPAIAASFPEVVTNVSTLRAHSVAMLKYNSTHPRTDVHIDNGVLALTLALSPQTDYEGGGTFFEHLGEDSLVEMDAGHATWRPGSVRHGGHRVSSGQRYIIGAFLLLEDRVEHVRRLKNRGMQEPNLDPPVRRRYLDH